MVLCKKYVTVHAYVSSNGICRGFAFKYGKFLLPPRFLTALSVPKVPNPCIVTKNITVPACVPGNLIWTYTQICGKVMDSDNVKKEK